VKTLSVARALQIGWLPARIINRILNIFARALTGRRISIDWRGLRVLHPEAIEIGDGFSAGHDLWLESVNGTGRLVIGSRVNCSDGVHIGCANSITIGSGVLVGSKVLITDHSHGHIDKNGARDLLVIPNERPIVSKGPISIEDNVWLGDGVCVLAGVTIGKAAIIGANSVVLDDVPPGSIWAGVPAREIRPRTVES
jgi:acetyltransferase-like isoleucine patch superfamily enzyme